MAWLSSVEPGDMSSVPSAHGRDMRAECMSTVFISDACMPLEKCAGMCHFNPLPPLRSHAYDESIV